MNIQNVWQRFRSVRYFMPEALYGDNIPGGAQMWRLGASSSFALKTAACVRLLRAHEHLYECLFSYKDYSDWEVSADKSLFLTYVRAFLSYLKKN